MQILVIMEHAVNDWNQPVVAELLAHVMRLPNRHVPLLVNFHKWCHPECSGLPADERRAYLSQPGNVAHHIRDVPDPFPEPEALELAQSWEIGSISIYKALREQLLLPIVPEPLSPTVFGQLTHEGTHPRAVHGLVPYSIYTVDLMIHWLRSAIAAIENPSRSASRITQRRSIDDAPPLPEHQVAATFELHPDNNPGKLTSVKVLANDNVAATADNTQPHVPSRYSQMSLPDHGLGEPDITAWFLVDNPIDGPAEVRSRYKPGLVSVSPGAAIELSITDRHGAGVIHQIQVRGRCIHLSTPFGANHCGAVAATTVLGWVFTLRFETATAAAGLMP